MIRKYFIDKLFKKKSFKNYYLILDKTGTLTQNDMIFKKFSINSEISF